MRERASGGEARCTQYGTPRPAQAAWRLLRAPALRYAIVHEVPRDGVRERSGSSSRRRVQWRERLHGALRRHRRLHEPGREPNPRFGFATSGSLSRAGPRAGHAMHDGGPHLRVRRHGPGSPLQHQRRVQRRAFAKVVRERSVSQLRAGQWSQSERLPGDVRRAPGWLSMPLGGLLGLRVRRGALRMHDVQRRRRHPAAAVVVQGLSEARGLPRAAAAARRRLRHGEPAVQLRRAVLRALPPPVARVRGRSLDATGRRRALRAPGLRRHELKIQRPNEGTTPETASARKRSAFTFASASLKTTK